LLTIGGLVAASAMLFVVQMCDAVFRQSLQKDMRNTGAELMLVPMGCPYDAAAQIARGRGLRVEEGTFVVVMGPSGSGKTTLLQIIGAMDRPTSGRVSLCGMDLSSARERELTRIRRDTVGFVFQHFGLLPTLTVAENIALPLMLARRRNPQRIEHLLHLTGLWERRSHRPSELSGGEMQRVAIARALANSPRLLLADEPTGNLDSTTGERVVALLREVNASGVTVVVVTHNQRLAAYAHSVMHLRDGRLEDSAASARQGD
jgi:ABC-type lipoprotein export system ATPase subunit